MNLINDNNREDIQTKYIEYLIAHLDFMEVRDMLRTYLHKEKRELSNFQLETEINQTAPDVFETSLSGLLMIGGYQNA